MIEITNPDAESVRDFRWWQATECPCPYLLPAHSIDPLCPLHGFPLKAMTLEQSQAFMTPNRAACAHCGRLRRLEPAPTCPCVVCGSTSIVRYTPEYIT